MPVCVGGRESYFFQRKTVVLWTESQISPVSKSLYLQKMFGCSGFCVLVLICFFLVGGGMWVEVYETTCFCLFGRDLWAKAVKRLVA